MSSTARLSTARRTLSPVLLPATLLGILLLLSTSTWADVCPAFLNHDFTKLHSSETVESAIERLLR